MKKFALPLMATLLLASSSRMWADEGMWTFDNLPLKLLKEKYNFTPSKEWLDHVRQSAISMGGCSASFVSADGLMLTNHHCGRGQVERISTKEKDMLINGFVARTQAEEIKVNMNIRVLKQMQNVTDKVNAAAKQNMDAKAAEDAKSAALQAAVESMQNSTGMSCSPVRLYQGGEYWVYGYEVFEDVRLVAAPEIQVASFGGDYDNFTYPRHDLDFMLFRVYKNDKPYRPANFLKWSVQGLKAGDLTFVVGHPGSTARGMTYGQMIYARDVTTPLSIKASERQRRMFLEYGKLSPENKRSVQTQLLGVENSLKATKGYYAGLLDNVAMAQLKAKEDELRAKVSQNAKLKEMAGQSWDQIDKALASNKENALLTSLATGAPTLLLTQLRSAVTQIETGSAP
ncbi:MAG: S46 family peptidase, partial [Holophagales bacterium]|nr:S46 family peptidase [Holophagales bacterium]